MTRAAWIAAAWATTLAALPPATFLLALLSPAEMEFIAGREGSLELGAVLRADVIL